MINIPTTLILIFLGTLIYLIGGIAWFLHRMGDKFGTDKRWWVKLFDAFLITPLLPLAALIGKIHNK